MTPINPLDMLVSAFKNGMNPLNVMQQYLGNDPRMGQAMQMIQGKSPAELRQIAENMAKERGTSIDAIAQNLGIKIPR